MRTWSRATRQWQGVLQAQPSPATLRRIAEYRGVREVSEAW